MADRARAPHILLAEDDPVARETVGAVLTAAGHHVAAVTDGAEAWETWRLSEQRVVVSDWLMPHVLPPPNGAQQPGRLSRGDGGGRGRLREQARGHGVCPDCYDKHLKPQLGG
jgi:CheY-like chemotaxis protein